MPIFTASPYKPNSIGQAVRGLDSRACFYHPLAYLSGLLMHCSLNACTYDLGMPSVRMQTKTPTVPQV